MLQTNIFYIIVSKISTSEKFNGAFAKSINKPALYIYNLYIALKFAATKGRVSHT